MARGERTIRLDEPSDLPSQEPSDLPGVPVGPPPGGEMSDLPSEPSDLPSTPVGPPTGGVPPELADLPRQGFLRGGPVRDRREGYGKGNGWKSPKGF